MLEMDGHIINLMRLKMIKREGVVRTYQHHNNRLAVVVEVSCDTDFVARNDQFLDFVDNMLMHIASNNPTSVENLLEQEWLFDERRLVADLLQEQNKKFGEKINIQSFMRWTLDPEQEEV